MGESGQAGYGAGLRAVGVHYVWALPTHDPREPDQCRPIRLGIDRSLEIESRIGIKLRQAIGHRGSAQRHLVTTAFKSLSQVRYVSANTSIGRLVDNQNAGHAVMVGRETACNLTLGERTMDRGCSMGSEVAVSAA
jgi:hypothetical protein